MDVSQPEIPEVDILRALADHWRLRIILLLTQGELCVCELEQVLSLPQSTASRHMSRLKLAGLVADRRQGKWVYYRLSESYDEDSLLMHELTRSLADRQPFCDDRARLRQLWAVDAIRRQCGE